MGDRCSTCGARLPLRPSSQPKRDGAHIYGVFTCRCGAENRRYWDAASSEERQ